ncbi:MAG: hypothetical protein DRO67_06840 [Candidatus Asgardarchaeum californiense]|nr:MAG: hypothetical protein DRO67_06840 [Candidatus Asgardarchaeum californiense]
MIIERQSFKRGVKVGITFMVPAEIFASFIYIVTIAAAEEYLSLYWIVNTVAISLIYYIVIGVLLGFFFGIVYSIFYSINLLTRIAIVDSVFLSALAHIILVLFPYVIMLIIFTYPPDLLSYLSDFSDRFVFILFAIFLSGVLIGVFGGNSLFKESTINAPEDNYDQ